MGFLKAFGAAVLKVTQIVGGLAPMVTQYVPQSAGVVGVVTSDLSQIAGIIGQVEVMGQALALGGSDKLKAAAPAVAQIILRSDLLATHKIKDEAKFAAAVNGIASNMADLLNSLEDKVPTTDKA